MPTTVRNQYHISFIMSFFFLMYIQNNVLAQKIPSTKNANIEAIAPPVGFEVSTAFNGYISMQNSAAIIMLQIDHSNYIRMFDAIDEDYIDRNKLELISKEKILTTSGDKGKGLTLSFDLNGDAFIRKMIFIGDTKRTLWLNITYPKHLQELIEKAVDESVKSTNLNLLD